MIHKLEFIGHGIWVVCPNMLIESSEKHSIRESHVATLVYAFHSMSDVIGKIEGFLNGETIEHVTQSCVWMIFVPGETYGIFTKNDVLFLEHFFQLGVNHLEWIEDGFVTFHCTSEDGENLFVKIEETVKTDYHKDVAKIGFIFDKVGFDDMTLMKVTEHKRLVDLPFMSGWLPTSGYLTSGRIPAFVSSSTSLHAASLHSRANHRFFFLMGLICLYLFSLCSVLKGYLSTMIVHGIPLMSVYVYANTSVFARRSCCNFLLKLEGSCFPIMMVCSGYWSLTMILSSTSVQLNIFCSLWNTLFYLFLALLYDSYFLHHGSSEVKIIRRVGSNDDEVKRLRPRVRNFSHGDFQTYFS
ncbi:hypothetical protein Tco_1448044 [Tanacetum coccineum]